MHGLSLDLAAGPGPKTTAGPLLRGSIADNRTGQPSSARRTSAAAKDPPLGAEHTLAARGTRCGSASGVENGPASQPAASGMDWAVGA